MGRTATVADLAPFSLGLLRAAGADQPSAEAATWAMLHASLHGVDSHGIRLLPWYADCLRNGIAKATRRQEIARATGDSLGAPERRHQFVHQKCAIGKDGQLVIKNVSVPFTGEVEITVVREAHRSRVVGGHLALDDENSILGQGVADAKKSRAGIAFLAIRAHVGEADRVGTVGAFVRLGLPNPLVQASKTAMQTPATLPQRRSV